jgi:hypothetical protein
VRFEVKPLGEHVRPQTDRFVFIRIGGDCGFGKIPVGYVNVAAKLNVVRRVRWLEELKADKNTGRFFGTNAGCKANQGLQGQKRCDAHNKSPDWRGNMSASIV